jgi:hypothetical protein
MITPRYVDGVPSTRHGSDPAGSTSARDPGALARARGERWLPDPLLTTMDEAAEFIARVGFAILFPKDRISAPSLWEAVAGPDEVPFASGMGSAEDLVWTWKDSLPRAGAAWYGAFVHKRSSLLSPTLLAALYPGDGDPADHMALDLPDDAHRIAEALLTGPLTTAGLRDIVGDRGRYDRAMVALQRSLLVTSAGVEVQRTGWPATVIDLTCRRFDVGDGPDYGYATARYAHTMIEVTAADLARAFGWSARIAQQRLDEFLPARP